jgi:hypothetical protein
MHHTGYVVLSIAEYLDRWITTLSAISASELFEAGAGFILGICSRQSDLTIRISKTHPQSPAMRHRYLKRELGIARVFWSNVHGVERMLEIV